ncbi:MAG: glutathione S-transferase family protein, partial [Rhodobiaceae bacterium]
MGLLIDGKWSTAWHDTGKTGGRFVREDARHRNWITADGSAGPSGEGGFATESGRYHLYVSHACPWAHRTLIFRLLKGLGDHISVSVVHPLMRENGWSFAHDEGGSEGDDLFGYDFLHQVYTRCQPHASGRVTVPVLWDRKKDCIVSNESSEIIRMFNSAFNAITGNHDDYWPAALRDDIEAVNSDIYTNINNVV